MIAIITTTVTRKKDALAIGKKLLDDQLIACSNITKVTSQYYWKGKYHEEVEYSITCKTTLDRKKQAVKSIKRSHPYYIPMIMTKECEINNAYLSWMDQQLD